MSRLGLAVVCVSLLLGAGAALASAPGSASAPSASAPLDAPPLPLSEVEIPSEKSALPTLEEWRSARPIAFTRSSFRARHCKASLVREWIKVHCSSLVVGIRQTAGSTEGTALFVIKPDIDGAVHTKGGQLIFPLRRDDARQFQFFDGEGGYEGLYVSPHVVVDAHWPTGDTPTLIVR